MMQALADPVLTVWRNRGLLRELTRRELTSRFVGSMLGVGWIVLQPIALLAVYVLVFGTFRVGVGGDEGAMAFVARLFVGILVFGLFAENANQAPRLVVSKPNFVTKVRFPLEVLPVPRACVGLIGFGVGVVVLLVFRAIWGGGVEATAVAVPLLILPLVLLNLGLAWLLASVGVFVRDLAEIVRVVVQLLFFLSPVVWTLDMVPERFRGFVLANPVALTIEWVRGAVASGVLPSPFVYLGLLAGAFGFSVLGLLFFRRTREGFADVL